MVWHELRFHNWVYSYDQAHANLYCRVENKDFKPKKNNVFNHRKPKLRIMTTGTVEQHSKYKELYGRKSNCFCSLWMWKDLIKNWWTSVKLSVSSFLCGFWANLWPFNGFALFNCGYTGSKQSNGSTKGRQP